MPACPACGAVYSSAGDNCASRFESLLALDHSRTEPWGSRHGLAVSAYALQHPDRFPPDVLERGWLMLFSIYVKGRDPAKIVSALRRLGRRSPDWDLPNLPAGNHPTHFTVTIADLGSFPAETYPVQPDLWCQSTLAAWQSIWQ
jgi:hypothetical protein